MSQSAGKFLPGEAGLAGPLAVSVVIPAYNRADLIERAVASVLGQQPRRPAEVIVVDDASSDGTGERAAQAGARVIRHEQNRGEAGARNSGIELATQPWIALLDSDDEWLPHHLETLWHLRDGHVLVADAMLACRQAAGLERYHGPVTERPVILGSPLALLFPQNFVNPSATMFRRDVGIRVGGYIAGYGTDLHFLLRLLEQGSAIVTPSIGGLYHVHEGQMTTDIRAFEAGLRTMLASYASRPWWSSRSFEKLRVVHAWDDLRRSLHAHDYARVLWRVLWILARPRRIGALVRMWQWRLRGRRRSGVVTREGQPTVALLPGWPLADSESAHAVAASFGAVVDLSNQGLLRTAVRLVRRPTSMGIARSLAGRVLLRVLGIPALYASRPQIHPGARA